MSKLYDTFIVDLMELCENNVPINLKSLINTAEDKGYKIEISSRYYDACQLELYEKVEVSIDKYEIIAAQNFASITLMDECDEYTIYVSRTDLIKIDTFDNDGTRYNNAERVDSNDTIYIVCITDDCSKDIANINIYKYPGDSKWNFVKRRDSN